MKSLPVHMPAIECPIQPSPGFDKKHLAEYKLDLCGLCNYGCLYCSSNSGNYLRIRREPFAHITEQQLGRRLLPADAPELTFMWQDIIPKLERQLEGKRSDWGTGKTMVLSMLTDGFGPLLIENGTTQRALQLVLERTGFRIRVLTKNAAVGSPRWVSFFQKHPGRFIVGLSTGSLDDKWARAVEIGTSPPQARLRAVSQLQHAGVPTYGMLCPVFPDVLQGDGLEQLVDQIHPERVEHVWAEPYNDRDNWQKVRSGYDPGSSGYTWMTRVFERGDKARWSEYATELYVRLREKAKREGWLHKLRYLLYELDITQQDAKAFAHLDGVLLQSKPDADGFSQNPHIAKYQRKVA